MRNPGCRFRFIQKQWNNYRSFVLFEQAMFKERMVFW